MEPLSLLLVVLVVHCGLYLADTLMRSLRPLPYLLTLRSLGLEVSLGQVGKTLVLTFWRSYADLTP